MTTTRSPEVPLRSSNWFEGLDMNGFIHRAWMKHNGFSPEALAGRPVIGICNTWSELVGCNVHLRGLAEAVKRGVLQAGGLPLEFATISVSDSIVKPNAMMYRNLLAMDVEELARANPLDAVVALGSCDKTTPAVLMGCASANLPSIVVTGGPQLSGWHRGRAIGSGVEFPLGDAVRAGEMTVEEFHEIEDGVSRSHGHCMDMGSASTAACVAEALGMTLPGCAAIPAVDVRRSVLAERSGRRAVELVLAGGPRPSDILTREAFENAIRVLQAIGGSTNAVMHLLALAGRVGRPIVLDDVAAARDTPLLVNLKPSGEHLMEEFFKAGGVPALVREMLPHLHADAMTVNGRTLGENAAGRGSDDHDVIRPLSDPLQPHGAIAVLRGSLAPGGAVIKRSAASPDLLRHRGPAFVFEDIHHLAECVHDKNLPVTRDTVLVLKQGGPKGGPGMPEWGHIPIPQKLLDEGVRDVVRVSDSRMSGTSAGTVVLHVTPESAVGGPLAAVRTGDEIALDVEAGSLDLLLDERELSRRLEEHRPHEPQYARGYGSLYLRHVTQADEGADFDFLQNLDSVIPEPLPLGLMRGWVGH